MSKGETRRAESFQTTQRVQLFNIPFLTYALILCQNPRDFVRQWQIRNAGARPRCMLSSPCSKHDVSNAGSKLARTIGSDTPHETAPYSLLPFVQTQTLSNPSLGHVNLLARSNSKRRHTLARKEGQTTTLKLPSSHVFNLVAWGVKLASHLLAIGTHFGHIPSLGNTSYCCYSTCSGGHYTDYPTFDFYSKCVA